MTNSIDARLQGLRDGAILALAYIVVALLLFTGALFLYEGMGVDFRILDYQILDPYADAYGVPAGLLLLGLAVATARLWIFGSDRVEGRRRETPPPSPAPRRVTPRLQFVPPTAAANENRATKVDTENIAAPGRTGANLNLSKHVLDAYDATSLVGLRTVVHNGAIESIDDSGGARIELPNLDELRAAAAVLRCLLPIRLRGREIGAIRKITGLGLGDLLERLGEEAPSQLLSRWESEDLSMDELTERRLRQVVCEELRWRVPRLKCDASSMAKFKIVDPWSGDPTFEIPPVILDWVQVVDETGSVSRTWNDNHAA